MVMVWYPYGREVEDVGWVRVVVNGEQNLIV